MSRDFCFKIGDKVCIERNGQTYSRYITFIQEHAEAYVSGFEEHYTPPNETIGEIVGRGLHDRDGNPLYVITITEGHTVVIGETGLEFISKINEEEFFDILNAF